MGSFIDYSGRRFGLLVVQSRAPTKANNTQWFCVCDCGAEVTASAANLSAGRQISCGCERKRRSAVACRARAVHGHAVGTKSPTYTVWIGMVQRCEDKNATAYARYGARGISVCNRWRYGEGDLSAFQCFLADVGARPSRKYSIDRIDFNGNYEPGNVRWATSDVQQLNKKTTKLSNEQVLAIIAMREAGQKADVIAKEFGVSGYYVRQLAAGKRRSTV